MTKMLKNSILLPSVSTLLSPIVHITDIDSHIEYINFAKEYGSKKGHRHPIWRRVICNYERFKNDNPDKMAKGDHCSVYGCDNDRRYPERYRRQFLWSFLFFIYPFAESHLLSGKRKEINLSSCISVVSRNLMCSSYNGIAQTQNILSFGNV